MKFDVGEEIPSIGIVGEIQINKRGTLYQVKNQTYSERQVNDTIARLMRPTSVEPQGKPEAVKLYCVKSCTVMGSIWFARGKTYTLENSEIRFESGWIAHCYKSLSDFMKANPSTRDCLVPLVPRPAKAGEWVLVKHTVEDSGGISAGDVALVVHINDGCGPYIRSKEKTCFGYSELGDVTLLKDDWCEVLDGYDGRYEQTEQPKLYSGKVVCVETHDDFTVGKVYTFKGGKVTDDGLARRPLSSYVAESLEAWNQDRGDCIARFIEYKGEAT